MTLPGGGGNRVHVKITGDKTDLKKELRGADKDIGNFDQKTESKLKQTANKVRGNMLLIAGAVAAGVAVTINRAEAMASAYAVTEAVIESTGGAANVTAEEIAELSKAQAFNTGINKLAVTEANNVLLTFKNLANQAGEGNDIFDQTSQIMLDMATVMGTDAKSGAIQLGKALNDPITGISALSRVGVTFTDVQKEQIRNFSESGDLMSAQKIILAELSSEFGGAAEAAADDSAKIARAFDEITEAIGTKLLPFLAAATREVLNLTGAISDLDKLGQITGVDVGTVRLATGAVGVLAQEINELNRMQVGWFTNAQQFTDSLNEILDESELTTEGLIGLKDNTEVLKDEFGLTTAQAEILADVIDQRLNKELRRTSERVPGVKRHLDELADSAEDVADETDGAASSVRDLQSALLEAASPALALVRAQDKAAEATAAYNQAVADGGDTSAEAIEAGFDLVEAYAELDATSQFFAEHGAAASSEALIQMMIDAGLLTGTIDEAREALENLNATPAVHKSFYSDPFGVDPRSSPPPIEFGLPRFQSGGVVPGRRGQAVAAVVHGGETVIPAGGGGNVIHNHIYIDGEQVMESIRKADRRLA